MNDYELLRKELEEILSGPGVTWNKQGILSAFDKAFAKMAVKLLAQLKQGDVT